MVGQDRPDTHTEVNAPVDKAGRIVRDVMRFDEEGKKALQLKYYGNGGGQDNELGRQANTR